MFVPIVTNLVVEDSINDQNEHHENRTYESVGGLLSHSMVYLCNW